MQEDPWREGNEVWFAFGPQGALGHRYLGKACTNGTRQGTPASFGPCGAAIDHNYGGGTDAKVFHPAAGYACGYQFTKPDGTPFYFPHQYAGEWRYPPVAAACPYTVCIGTNPGIIIFVTLAQESAGIGRVVSNPRGITATRAGEFSRQFPGDVTLTAEPMGKHARAVFSGACTNTGRYGERAECLVKLAPDPKVTVSFECEKGFVCGKGRKD